MSDQGRNFESELISELCKHAKVEKVHTTPYYPMTNGQCERFNSTLCNILGTLPEKEKADKKSHLGSMTHAYNCTKHPSTTYSPYYLMFGRQPRLPIDYEMGLPIDVLGDTCSKTRYVQKLKQRLDFAYKRAREISQKHAHKYKLSYDKKVKGSQLQVDDLVLVKRVAWTDRHKIQNKWEPDEYVVVAQPNKSVPVYRVKPIGEGKERVLHRNLLLPLGIKFVPEIESDSDSDQEEEPELEICQVERQISEGKPQATSVENMTPLADLEHGQGIVDPKFNSIVTPVDHVEPVEQGSMAPPVVISTDNLIDSQMSLDPILLVPIDETVGSIPTQLTNLPSENLDDSLVLPSTKENSDSLMKTEEYLDFVDDLSQKPSSVIEEEKTCHTDIAPSIQVDETSHSLAQESKILLLVMKVH